MNRRELLAGVTSAGVLGGAAATFRFGLPSFATASGAGSTADSSGGDGDSDGDGNGNGNDSGGPIELETIDARGSEAGTLPVPNDGVTVVMFFSPACGTCRKLMPHLAAARERLVDAGYGDALTVVSVTARQSESSLREWWLEYEGNWYLGFDPGRSLAAQYQVVGYPVLVAVDEDGNSRWTDTGVVSADRIVRNVEPLLEDALSSDDTGSDSDGSDGNETDDNGEGEAEAETEAETEPADGNGDDGDVSDES
ncbi:alkyl hydroperoxide reductase [Halobiforma lacisalsi AJ5]|uniref:Alkyl hydroperoxide reductase n=1 Tax=Natronobacterium lacisalsi AJ5 TaxID=358396 RepID=M0LQV1_NATLA|nr:TlpA disulfide reductase family protein [Halobiforma lacisalsi]APW99871.1 alkyl hydroperoxide reductase [Halobiforma lacisalsi AJ5]EMA35947.1 alkyl hydroperoxide reductase/ thiol specific antioxidant/ Mal allergen [Halobiforma lacisalsi AJ5]